MATRGSVMTRACRTPAIPISRTGWLTWARTSSSRPHVHIAPGGGPSVQTIPANLDAATKIFQSFVQLTIGDDLIPSDDIFLDGTLSNGGTVPSTSSYFEGMVNNGYPGLVSNQNVISGTAGFAGTSALLGGAPGIPGPINANLAGQRLGVAAFGFQLTANGVPVIVEVANALTINLQ